MIGAIWITLPQVFLALHPALIQPDQMRFLNYLLSIFSFLLLSFNFLSRDSAMIQEPF
ncbi:hypothetical protein F5879DRAFT_983391, partial [Lentinula edodes]